MKVAVVMNAAAGSIGEGQREERVQQIRDAFAAAGVETEMLLCEPAHLTETARKAARQGFDAVVAAGGDGTVSALAGALAGGEVPLAVLPLGTLNHFARDLGMPDDLVAAARAIATKRTVRVDVGELNGRVFINNSSIGLYPEMVMRRDIQQKQSGRSKWPAMLLAAFRVLRRFKLLTVRVQTPETTCMTRTPFVFVGNNAYSMAIPTVGKRVAIDQGHLGLYLLHSKSRLHMIWVVLRALLGRAKAAPALTIQLVTEVDIRSHRRALTVALDGEVVRMRTPLHYRIRAAALPVLAPPAKEATEPVTDTVTEPPASTTAAEHPPTAVASYATASGAR